ncbi:MAG: prolyl oligopeptidase family serine peptidase [Polyangiaceae bacterium]
MSAIVRSRSCSLVRPSPSRGLTQVSHVSHVSWRSRVWLASFAAVAVSACGDDPVPRTPHDTDVTAAHSISKPTTVTIDAVRTKKMDVTDDYFGTKVVDSYRWLEDADGADVKAWTDAENARTRKHLDGLGVPPEFTAGIKGLLEVGAVGTPFVVSKPKADATTKGKGPRLFHTKREGEQNQAVLYVRDGVDGKDRVLVDPVTLSKDGTTALDWWYPSPDGALVAWGRSESGSEESTLAIRDVAKGTDLPDLIPYTRHASVAWLPDGTGFYYSRHPTPGTVPAGDEKYFAKLFFHKLGTDSKDDKLVFGDGRDKTDVPTVALSPNGKWLVVRVHMGWQKSEVYLKDLGAGEKAPWVEVATKAEALFDPIPRNDVLYLHTNDGSPRFRLVAVDYKNPGKAKWKDVIPEGEDVLEDPTIVGDTIVGTYLHDASTVLRKFDRKTGKGSGTIPLPSIGSAGVSGAWDGSELFVGFTSFVAPTRIFRRDLKTGKEAFWDQVGANFAAKDVNVELRHAVSKDGTKVPMFVVSKEGTPKDGTAPAVLYGYGGFNVNQTPAFSARALTVVAHGGVWVSAVLRGGGEFGETWHQGGMLGKKQNVFDDFIACAETLVKDKITSSDRLGILGGSNGGLLTATMVTQRPDLFRAALSLVPLTDMLRYHRFRIGKLWVPEYGSSDDPEQFKFLYAYSPYHRVKDGTRYPATLFTTAESDSRVDPMHARKMAARLAEAQGDPTRPVLIRVESKAGHGAGKPVTKLTAELSDELSFLFKEIGIPFVAKN